MRECRHSVSSLHADVHAARLVCFRPFSSFFVPFTPPMPPSIRTLLALVAVTAIAACGSDSPSGPTLRLEAVGRLERGSTVRIVARDGATAADSVVTNVVVAPAAAGAVSG